MKFNSTLIFSATSLAATTTLLAAVACTYAAPVSAGVVGCNAQAISQAVAAGGEVVVDCGTTPTRVVMSRTRVTKPTSLRALRPGTLILSQANGSIFMASATTFEVLDIEFVGAPTPNEPLAMIHAHGDGLLKLTNTIFSVHRAVYLEGGVAEIRRSTFHNIVTGSSFGGALFAGGTLRISDSTFANNRSGRGTAIDHGGKELTVSNCTFVNNIARLGQGIDPLTGLPNVDGAIIQSTSANASISFSTFANNTGVAFSRRPQVSNTIIVGKVANDLCTTSGQGNIVWPNAPDYRCSTGFTHANPRLGRLANNGGPTQTMALLYGSAAINAVVGTCPSTDQRGVLRYAGCDVGAYERNP